MSAGINPSPIVSSLLTIFLLGRAPMVRFFPNMSCHCQAIVLATRSPQMFSINLKIREAIPQSLTSPDSGLEGPPSRCYYQVIVVYSVRCRAWGGTRSLCSRRSRVRASPFSAACRLSDPYPDISNESPFGVRTHPFQVLQSILPPEFFLPLLILSSCVASKEEMTASSCGRERELPTGNSATRAGCDPLHVALGPGLQLVLFTPVLHGLNGLTQWTPIVTTEYLNNSMFRVNTSTKTRRSSRNPAKSVDG
jgi:hypothetical protein